MKHDLLSLASRALLLLLLAVGAAHAADDDASTRDDYWDDKNRGWFFYERKPKKPEPPPPVTLALAPQAVPAPPPAPAEPPKSPKHPDLVRFEALQKRVEDTRNIAIINPTEANIREHLEAQQLALDTAKRFGEASNRVMWATPQFDPSLTGRPTSPSGAALYDAEQERTRNRGFGELAKTHAFFFFFKSDCPYCHRFSPTLRQFSARTGIQIMPISLDGGGIDGFPDFKTDNGIAARLSVTQVPALFLAEPTTGKVLPVGYGVMAMNELERRVEHITLPNAETIAPSTVKFINGLASR